MTQRLYDAGATFLKEITTTVSPWISTIVYWIVMIVIFSVLGNIIPKADDEPGCGQQCDELRNGQEQRGCPSEEEIRFTDVAGEDEAKENLSEIVDYLHDPNKYASIDASMPRVSCS